MPMDPKPRLTEAEQDAIALRIRTKLRGQFEDMVALRHEIKMRKTIAILVRLLPAVAVLASIGWALSR